MKPKRNLVIRITGVQEMKERLEQFRTAFIYPPVSPARAIRAAETRIQSLEAQVAELSTEIGILCQALRFDRYPPPEPEPVDDSVLEP